MARTVGIGIQSFEKLAAGQYFYVDKTGFIKTWWENGDEVTLITRPRRFGKTLTMSMVEQFFSVKYADRGALFEGLSIWQEEKYRRLQGAYPVISLSFANVKESGYEIVRTKICQLIVNLYAQYSFLYHSEALTDMDRTYWDRISVQMNDSDASLAIHQLSDYLYRYYGKKVIILLDEYDTPMQEAYVGGYWQELVAFTRNIFNSTFKTNPYLERAIMTGITRVSKESVFSDLNNPEVVTTTSDKYADCFGFTENEVFAALDEFGLSEKKGEVKAWYDGFTFGSIRDIYNPWSILNFLDKKSFGAYWANTSANSLVSKLIREGSRDIKTSFEALLRGEHLLAPVDEQIVYDQLNEDETAIWSLLLASGYLKVIRFEQYQSWETEPRTLNYELALTNMEVKIMFYNMVKGWFGRVSADYNDFVKALLLGDLDAMNDYMNSISAEIFSSFDTGKRVSQKAEPERFYHGFVLGLIVDLADRYCITSNRESGFGRYDVMLEPKKKEDDAIIIEFKVFNARKEKTLEDTVRAALVQIEKKEYGTSLLAKGIPAGHIRKYGFAFEGKTVLIGE